MKPSLSIAIDFDDTFTASPELWSAFIQNAKRLGHRPMIVTSRRNSEWNTEIINNLLDTWGCQVPIHFCNLASKVETMRQRGFKVDIWIDDSPNALVFGH